MYGIDLDSPIKFNKASFRYFNKNEYHITRISEDNVLLLVFDGVLRFCEDEVSYEVKSGEYHIQRKGSYQCAKAPSDCPKYLYVHFDAEWGESEHSLQARGVFDVLATKAIMEKLDRRSHEGACYVKKAVLFYELLLLLRKKEKTRLPAGDIADYIDSEFQNGVTLLDICQKFNFSKNHVINIFKKEYGITPVKYINRKKLSSAKYLLEVTSSSVESIAIQSGFNDYSHFYKLFCQEVGTSPAKYRIASRQG